MLTVTSYLFFCCLTLDTKTEQFHCKNEIKCSNLIIGNCYIENGNFLMKHNKNITGLNSCLLFILFSLFHTGHTFTAGPVVDIRVSKLNFEDAFKKVRPSVSKKVSAHFLVALIINHCTDDCCYHTWVSLLTSKWYNYNSFKLGKYEYESDSNQPISQKKKKRIYENLYTYELYLYSDCSCVPCAGAEDVRAAQRVPHQITTGPEPQFNFSESFYVMYVYTFYYVESKLIPAFVIKSVETKYVCVFVKGLVKKKNPSTNCYTIVLVKTNKKKCTFKR